MSSIGRPHTKTTVTSAPAASLNKKIQIAIFVFGFALYTTVSAQAEKTNRGGNSVFLVKGGSAENAESLARAECKKLSRFFNSAELVDEHLVIWWGQSRYYRCSFLGNASETVRPSSLEQRSLQSRKFNKDLRATNEALNNWIKDNGYAGRSYRVQIQIEQQVLMIDIEAKVLSASSTILRIRTFEMSRGKRPTEFFSPIIYQLIFSEIAQQLFTEAIDLEPAEMN